MLEVDPLHFENIERASGLTLWNQEGQVEPDEEEGLALQSLGSECRSLNDLYFSMDQRRAPTGYEDGQMMPAVRKSFMYPSVAFFSGTDRKYR